MPQAARPTAPHLTVYRWQIQMVTSIVHRATGVALAVGTAALFALLGGLAAGPEAYARVQACLASPFGIFLMIGWTWSFAFHLLNGLRHLYEDAGYGYKIGEFVATSWISVIGSVVLTALVWACVFLRGGAA